MAQILGIDTSNYTTSAALLDLETGEVHQEKQLLPVKAGEAGLRQSDAVFHHTRQLPELLERLRPFLAENPVCGVSVSTRPRNVDGSYMPCFLTGVGTARAVAAVTGVPLYETSHPLSTVPSASCIRRQTVACALVEICCPTMWCTTAANRSGSTSRRIIPTRSMTSPIRLSLLRRY